MTTTVRAASVSSTPSILVFAQRERTRSMARAIFPRRRHHVVMTRTVAAFEDAFRATLVDAFFGFLSLRASDAQVLGQCVACEFCDVLVEGVDESVARDLVIRDSFTARFARALHDPPSALGLCSTLQQTTWRSVVAHAGVGVRTDTLAQCLHVTREHLSRTFAVDRGPNLKRVIDLVRLLAAAELAKNPGYDVRDVARVLGFASPSHLSTTSQRIVGTKSASLSRLRTIDLIERFARGHGRSRPSK
jgi:AraC-like DNA-binding protein